MNELAKDNDYDFYFYGDVQNRMMPGVPLWTEQPKDRVRNAQCFPLIMGIMLQAGLIKLALDSKVAGVIYLGDWKWPCTWLSAMISRIAGKRVLFWTHGWTRRDRAITSLVRRGFYRIAHGLLLYGNRARDIGISLNFPANTLYVVYNSLDYAKQVVLRDEPVNRDLVINRLFGRCDRPVVICCSRVQKGKRIELLLYASKILHEEGHPIDIIVVGDGPARHALEELSKVLGLSVHFEGACYDEVRNATLFRCSSVTVSPGPVGLTAIHSMTYGVPVITTDNMTIQKPEVEIVVEGLTGSFYRDGDTESLAESIKKWTKSISPEEHIQNNCKSVVDGMFNPLYQVSVIKRALKEEVPSGVTVEEFFRCSKSR